MKKMFFLIPLAFCLASCSMPQAADYGDFCVDYENGDLEITGISGALETVVIPCYMKGSYVNRVDFDSKTNYYWQEIRTLEICGAGTEISARSLSYVKKLILPEGYYNLDKADFSSSSVKEIVFNGSVPPSIGANEPFSSTVEIYVPDSAVSSYKSAWTKYASQIYAASGSSYDDGDSGNGDEQGSTDSDGILYEGSFYLNTGLGSDYELTIDGSKLANCTTDGYFLIFAKPDYSGGGSISVRNGTHSYTTGSFWENLTFSEELGCAVFQLDYSDLELLKQTGFIVFGSGMTVTAVTYNTIVFDVSKFENCYGTSISIVDDVAVIYPSGTYYYNQAFLPFSDWGCTFSSFEIEYKSAGKLYVELAAESKSTPDGSTFSTVWASSEYTKHVYDTSSYNWNSSEGYSGLLIGLNGTGDTDILYVRSVKAKISGLISNPESDEPEKGTFAAVPVDATSLETLSSDTWRLYYIIDTPWLLYKFVPASSPVYISWADAYSGDAEFSSYTPADVKVSVYLAGETDSSKYVCFEQDSGYETPVLLAPENDSYYIIKVEKFSAVASDGYCKIRYY